MIFLIKLCKAGVVVTTLVSAKIVHDFINLMQSLINKILVYAKINIRIYTKIFRDIYEKI